MKRSERILRCTVAGVVLCAAASAAAVSSSGSPYQAIVVRNVFDLKPPPPPVDPATANKQPPPKIMLQGFTTFGGTKRVLFKMQPPVKTGEPPKGEQSYVLAEGQREGDVEILEIDPAAGTAKVNNFGTITNLSFENNGIKVASSPVPGAPPGPGGFVPPPAGAPYPPGGGATLFNRPVRSNPTGASSSFPGSTAPVAASGSSPYGGNPSAYGGRTATLSLGGASVPLVSSPAPVEAQPQPSANPNSAQSLMSAAQREVAIEAYRQHMLQLGKQWPPTPPSPPGVLTPPATQ